jgi:streptogramin lyase
MSPRHHSILTGTYMPCQWHLRHSNSQYPGWRLQRHCVQFKAEWRCARLDLRMRVWMLEWEASVLLKIECSKDNMQTTKTSSPNRFSILTGTYTPCQWHWRHSNSQYPDWRLLPHCVEFNAECRCARWDLRVCVWMLEWEVSVVHYLK